MTNINAPKVIVARKVKDGKIVYLTECDAWTPDIEIAENLSCDDQEWRLAFARRLREVENAVLANLPIPSIPQTAVA